MELAYIYTLSDPRTGEVRYVGKTFDLRQRLWDHLSKARKNEPTKKYCWIRKLLREGVSPVMDVLETFREDDVLDWEEAEKFWISTLSFYGFRLTNLDSGGGSGRRASIETRIKIGEISKRRVHTLETRAKISASCKARMTPEEKENLRLKCSKNRHTEETKKLISKLKIGKPRPAHVRAALLAGSIRWREERKLLCKNHSQPS